MALDPEQLKESIKLLDEFEKRTEELREGNKQAQDELRKDMYTAMEEYFDLSFCEISTNRPNGILVT